MTYVKKVWNFHLALCICSLGFVVSLPVLATWSIVAVDETTQDVGSAGASCTGFIAGIVELAPEHGVIVNLS